MKIKKSLDEEIATKLIEIGIEISVERNLDKLLNKINNEAQKLLSADKGTIYLVDEKLQQLKFYITDTEMLSEMRLPLDKSSIAGYVGITGKELNIKDVYKIPKSEPYSFNKAIDEKTKYRTKSALTVPMQNHRNEIIGVVQLINKIHNNKIIPFTQKDTRILKALSSLAAVSIENAQLYKEIEDLFESFVSYSIAAIDARDPATAGHSKRVAMISEYLARAMGCFSEEEIKEIKYTALVHDIGKIGVRENVLVKENKLYPEEFEVIRNRFDYIKMRTKHECKNDDEFEKKLREIEEDFEFISRINIPGFLSDEDLKKLQKIAQKTYINFEGKEEFYIKDKEFEALSVRKGNLTPEERIQMEGHAKYTYEILNKINFTKNLKNVPLYACCHHEKLDGSGYPDKRTSKNIPIQSKIIAIADIFEALISQERKYKPAMPIEKAIQIIKSDAENNKLDPEIVKTFIEKKVYEIIAKQVNQQ